MGKRCCASQVINVDIDRQASVRGNQIMDGLHEANFDQFDREFAEVI